MRLNPRYNPSGSDYINADFVKVKSIINKLQVGYAVVVPLPSAII